MFSDLQDRLSKTIRNLRGVGKIREANISDALGEIKESLLASDVQYRVAQSLLDSVKSRALGQEVLASVDPGQQFVKILYDEIRGLLGGTAEPIPAKPKGRPQKILLMGLQGSGKTTTAAKLASYLKRESGRQPLLVAADTQRPAAREQLEQLAHTQGIGFFSEPGEDSAKICQAGLARVEGREIVADTVIFDTAGRLSIDAEMMADLARVKEALRPDLSLYVLDAMAGQSAAAVAKEFMDAVGFDGVILTKLDSDARGGAALSVRWVTGRPVYFAGTGETPQDFEVLHPDRLASRILGMGDVVSLVEQAQKVFDEKQSAKMAEKLRKNEFTVEDFADQMGMIQKLGSFDKILGMLPGGAQLQRSIPVGLPEAQMKKIDAMIKSMTPRERRNVQILDGRRRARIAAGSGTTVADLNRFLKQFVEAKKMASQWSKMGLGALGANPFNQRSR